jgi:toxin ParE1/3/4
MSRYEFTDQAIADLEGIHDYIARNSPAAAARLVALIRERCFLLAENPMMGRSRPELAPDLRSFPVGSYIIFYRPLTNGIQVIHVVSGARDIEALF